MKATDDESQRHYEERTGGGALVKGYCIHAENKMSPPNGRFTFLNYFEHISLIAASFQ